MTLNGVMALFCVVSANSGSFRAHCVKVHVRYLIYWWFLVVLYTHHKYFYFIPFTHYFSFSSRWISATRYSRVIARVLAVVVCLSVTSLQCSTETAKRIYHANNATR